MNTSLSAPVFDIAGQVYIPARPVDSAEIPRRVSRVATLDGGVAITDGGFSDGDRTLTVSWRTIGSAHLSAIEALVRNYPLLNLATEYGFFVVAVQTFNPGAANSSIVLLVKEKVAD